MRVLAGSCYPCTGLKTLCITRMKRLRRTTQKPGESAQTTSSAPIETTVTTSTVSGTTTSGALTATDDNPDSFNPRKLLNALIAARNGDFSVRLPAEWTGLEGKIADAFNDIMVCNETMSKELERVSTAVGKEGKIRQRASFNLHGGAWREMEEKVNGLIGDLVWPITEFTRSIGSVAKGDLSQAMSLEVDGRPLVGEFLRSAQLFNTMIGQLNVFTSEVTRVAREVGTEGKLGGQAQVKNVSGVWKELTDNVNSMAANLTGQVRNIADVTIAVANGDLSRKITVDVRGDFLQLKDTINTMVEQLRSFASEVTRVAREVGTEGKLGGQAIVPGVAGTWKDLTDNVNGMAANLTGQVRNIALVTTAVAKGDLSQKITVAAQGEILELKNTINTMVEQLNGFASEVTRVAREVGHRRQTWGPGQCPRRRWNVEGPHRQCQRHGGQPHCPGPQYCGRDYRGRERRPLPENYGGCSRRISPAQGNHQYHGRPTATASPPKSPVWRAKSGPKASWADRPMCPGWPAHGKISPTTSTAWRRT